MIRLPDIEDLALIGVLDRGVANRERIMLKVLKATEMAQFGVILAWNAEGPESPAQPLNDFFFWFGDGIVQPNETIFLFTGEGEPRRTTVEGTTDPAYVVHWGRPNTLFADSRVVPVVVSFGQILLAKPPVNLPQRRQLPKSKKG